MTALVVALIDDPEHEIAYDGDEVEVVTLNGWLINDAPPFDESFIEDMQFHMDVCAELLGGEWIEWQTQGAGRDPEDEPDTRRLLTNSQKYLLWSYYQRVDEAKQVTEEHFT